MNTDLAITLLKAAGLLHFGILCAGLPASVAGYGPKTFCADGARFHHP